MQLDATDIIKIMGHIEMVEAIETLEYHNKNYLAGGDSTRSRAKRKLLSECLALLGTTAKDEIG